MGVAYLTRCSEPAALMTRSERRESALTTEYAFRARAGRRYRLHQIACLVPSVLHHQPHREAVRLASRGGDLGFEELRRQNRAAWQELWQGRIHLVGAILDGRGWPTRRCSTS